MSASLTAAAIHAARTSRERPKGHLSPERPLPGLPPVIGLTGKAGAGKDTVAGLLAAADARVEIRAFAEPLKRSVAALFGIDRSDVDRLKVNPRAEVWIVLGNCRARAQSFRTLLQRYGTEAHRDVFGADFWLDATLPLAEDRRGKVIVVTDCRFPNEAERIRAVGGEVWRVERPAALLAGEEAAHVSEAGLPDGLVDRVIPNAGAIDDLQRVILPR